MSTIFGLINTDIEIARIVSTFCIPSTVLCRRAEMGESSFDDSSGDIAIYEEVLAVGLRFLIPMPMCCILV